jgi:hypothetical protein
MANLLRGNIHYITATGALEGGRPRVCKIIITATAANAVLALQDSLDASAIMNLRVATSGASQEFDFSNNPLNFPNGLTVGTLTNAIAHVIYAGRGNGE